MIQTQTELNTALFELEPLLREKYGLKRFGYFGSFARNEQRADSDVDVLYEADDDSFELCFKLERLLKDNTGRDVQFIHAPNLRNDYKAGILEDVRYIQDGRIVGGHQFLTENERVHRMKIDDVYLKDILYSMERIEHTVSEIKLWEYLKYQDRKDIVDRRFQIIGDAIKLLSPQLKLRHPEIPWQHLADLRNKIVHDYNSDYNSQVWSLIHHEIIPNIETMKKIVKKEVE